MCGKQHNEPLSSVDNTKQVLLIDLEDIRDDDSSEDKGVAAIEAEINSDEEMADLALWDGNDDFM
jgi:hypothetical protein